MRERKISVKFNGRIMAGLLMLVFVLLFTSTTTQAASQKTKAMKAYASFLSKNRYLKWTDRPNMRIGRAKNCYFAVAYIDNNNVPELVLYTPDSSHVAGFGVMYTYRNGRVVRVSELCLDLRSTLGYYKKKNVYLDNYSSTGLGSYSYARISKQTLGGKSVRYNYRTRKWATTGYTWNNKFVSKAYFDRALKRVVGKTRFTKYKFYKNTSSNRRRYLK